MNQGQSSEHLTLPRQSDDRHDGPVPPGQSRVPGNPGLFRFGDFYEMFYDDAAIAARALDITLTSRPQGKNTERVPMCGSPHYRLDAYLSRLVEKGFKVAICEQLEGSQKGGGCYGARLSGSSPRAHCSRSATPNAAWRPCGSDSADRVGLAVLSLATGEFVVAETNRTELPSLLAKFPGPGNPAAGRRHR